MDLNRDGLFDLISGSWPGEVYWFRRLPDGSFDKGETLAGADGKPLNVGHASAAFAAQWDSDETLDLVVGTLTGEVLLLRGREATEAPAFGPSEKLTCETEPITVAGGEAAPAVADWDGDGLPDLVLGSATGSVVWHRNVGAAGQPKLDAARPLLGESPVGWKDDAQRRPGEWGLRVKPCLVDWNGDGKLDLLLGDRCGGYQARPNQTPDEAADERRATDELPSLRKAWAAAFADFQRLSAGESTPELAAIRERLKRLKDEIAKVQEVQIRYQPGQQSHGFVWLFLRQ